MELEPKYIGMINQLRLTNSEEDVGNFLKAVMMHDLAKEYHVNNQPKLFLTISGDANFDNLKLSGYFNLQNAEIKYTDKTDSDQKLREVCMKNFGYFGDEVQVKINEIINVAKSIYVKRE